MMVGFSMSVTVTVKAQVAVSPTTSVANHSTRVLPLGKTEPVGNPFVRVVVALWLSVAVTP